MTVSTALQQGRDSITLKLSSCSCQPHCGPKHSSPGLPHPEHCPHISAMSLWIISTPGSFALCSLKASSKIHIAPWAFVFNYILLYFLTKLELCSFRILFPLELPQQGVVHSSRMKKRSLFWVSSILPPPSYQPCHSSATLCIFISHPSLDLILQDT